MSNSNLNFEGGILQAPSTVSFKIPETPSNTPHISQIPSVIPQTSKKYQKIKHEIDLQSFEVAQLTRELKTRSKNNFPVNCLQQTETKLCNARQKLNAMVKCAMLEQQKYAGENWGPIPVAFDGQEQFSMPKTPSNLSQVSGISNCQLEDYESLADEKLELQNEILRRDETLNELEDKLEATQRQLLRMCQENKAMTQKMKESQSGDEQKDLNLKLCSQVESAAKLSGSIDKLSTNLSTLRCELDGLKKQKKISFELQNCDVPETRPCPCPTEDARKLRQLESQYVNLQTEFCQREKQYKEMMERMEGLMDKCDQDKERAVNEALKKRADEMVEEIRDNKVFIRELQEQVDGYREKFMKAQEKVEYQRYLLENLEMSNKDVESQINDEIIRIKEKFQQKLAELCPYPEKYEKSKIELEEGKKRIQSLESDLRSVMAALGKSTEELKVLRQKPVESHDEAYKKLKIEVEMMKKKYCDVKATKECLEDKLACMKKELESLRKDSSKIISTTKCCAEKNRNILHQHINCLEVELAQCRASSSVVLSQKEETIKRMQEELAKLCCCFNDSQVQIQQLKNQVTYLTNQRHKIRPEDINQIDFCFPEA